MSLPSPMSWVAAGGLQTRYGELMLVQFHGQNTRPRAASEQSARDGCSVSLQETSALEAGAAFTDVKRRVNCSGVVTLCRHPKHRWHVERCSHQRR
jgi:hypothetical protein